MLSTAGLLGCGVVQGPSTASKDEALHTRDMRREGGFSQGHSGGGVSSRSSSSGSGGASDVDDYVPPTVALMHRARQHAGELSARSGVEKAAAALAAVPAAAKAAKEATISAGRPIIPGVPPGAIVDDAETSAGEDCPVEVGIGDSGELVYSFRKSGRPRRGKWSRLEEEFAKRCAASFLVCVRVCVCVSRRLSVVCVLTFFREMQCSVILFYFQSPRRQQSIFA